NGGIEMSSYNKSNSNWISAKIFTASSPSYLILGTFNNQIVDEWQPTIGAHNYLLDAWRPLWVNTGHASIFGDITYSGSQTNQSNKVYVLGNMECSDKLRFDGKTSDDIVTTGSTPTNNDLILGNGTKTIKISGITYDGSKLSLPTKAIDGVTTLTCT